MPYVTDDLFVCSRCNIEWDENANPPPRCPNCGQGWTAIPISEVAQDDRAL